MSVDYRIGDTRAVISTIADGSVDLIASSPPFLALRSYLPAGHEAKGDEIGSERNPAEFIDMLLGLTVEWGRVLAPHGSIAIELGDTYSGSGGDPPVKVGQWIGSAAWGKFDASTGAGRNNSKAGAGWPRAKSLALIPQLYAIALAYGINPLTGQPSPAGRWLVRNVIVWHRPNPAVGALGDKYRPSTSYIVVATRSPKRWFDLSAVRHAHTVPNGGPLRGRSEGMKGLGIGGDAGNTWDAGERLGINPAGAPPLDAWFDQYDGDHDTWTLTTQPSKLAHYAMWPAKLAERLILSMCPAQVCAICGEPRRRIERNGIGTGLRHVGAASGDESRGPGGDFGNPDKPRFHDAHPQTLGWTDCGHDTYVPGTVLDPFAGTGTTLAVADLHGRDAIGIDIDARNRNLYPARRAECSRNLFDSPMPDEHQLDLFGAAS